MYSNTGNDRAKIAMKKPMGLEIDRDSRWAFGRLPYPHVEIVMIARRMAMPAFSCPISGDRAAQLPCACSRRVYLAHKYCYGTDYWLCMAVSSVTSTEGEYTQYTIPVIR